MYIRTNLIILAILGVTVLAAGAFAVLPVQKATTVHSSTSTTLGDMICDAYDGNNQNDNLEFNPATNDCVIVE